MKVENVQSIKNIPEKQQPQLLKQGEFFVSEVLEVRGETALLKSAQGTLLTARLLGDLWLNAGDHVETVVDEAHGSRYVLRVVDVSPGQASNSGVPETPSNTAVQSVRAQMLYGMLTMLKRKPGLDPKMAEFMASNGLTDTPENIDTLAKLVKGELKTDQVLQDMQGEAARAGTVLANRSASLGQGGAFETAVTPAAAADVPVVTAAAPVAAQAQPVTNPAALDMESIEQPPVSDSAAVGAASVQQTKVQKTVAAAPQAVELPAPPEAVAVQAPAENPAAQPADPMGGMPADTSGQQAPAVAIGTAAAGSAAQAVQQAVSATSDQTDGAKLPIEVWEPAVLAGRLAAFVVDIRSRKTLPAQLKKAAEELPAQIKELKISLQSTDNNDRNTLARHAESLDRQFSLMSELKRFDCYHIPLTGMSREQNTAELYVFRQRRRKKDADPETFAVLLGLDTQHLGRVEAMIRAAGHSVGLEFRLENAELTDAFNEAAKALEPLIEQAGYRLTEVNVRELTARTTVLNAEEALSDEAAPDTGSLDIRI